MDKSTPVADRVRPILHAMERSIDAARRRRLHPNEITEPASPATTTPVGGEPPRTGGEDNVPRLKARPKRPAYDGTPNVPFRTPSR